MSKKSKQEPIEYSSGRNLAEKCFNDYSETGECELGSIELQAPCEMVAEAIKDAESGGEPITKNNLEDITFIKERKNTQFYDGVCDFLIKELEKRL